VCEMKSRMWRIQSTSQRFDHLENVMRFAFNSLILFFFASLGEFLRDYHTRPQRKEVALYNLLKSRARGLKFRDNLVSLPYMYYGGQNNSFKN